jgi:hypothetical protein
MIKFPPKTKFFLELELGMYVQPYSRGPSLRLEKLEMFLRH